MDKDGIMEWHLLRARSGPHCLPCTSSSSFQQLYWDRGGGTIIVPFMDEETEAQKGWLEHFPRVPILRVSDFALGTAGVGWRGGQAGRAGVPRLRPCPLLLKRIHEPRCEAFPGRRVLLLGGNSMMAAAQGVGGAGAGTASLTFGLGVIMNWVPRSGRCGHVTGGVSCVYVCVCVSPADWGLLGWGRG